MIQAPRLYRTFKNALHPWMAISLMHHGSIWVLVYEGPSRWIERVNKMFCMDTAIGQSTDVKPGLPK